MSTRSTIQFKDKHRTFTVYKHYDGYPENMNELFERFKLFNKERESDISYTVANFIHFVKNEENSPLTGIGITTNRDWQEYNYLYEIKDGKVLISLRDAEQVFKVKDNNGIIVYETDWWYKAQNKIDEMGEDWKDFAIETELRRLA